MRPDHKIICKLIKPNSKILDLGCGNGDLLYILNSRKNTDGRGIELHQELVQSSIEKGLSVIQGNLEEIIINYPDKSFDYCILSQTIQELRSPQRILHEMLRVGKQCIIAFYNLAQIKYRLKILFKGKFPKANELPYNWLSSNVMFLNISDFLEFCRNEGIIIQKRIFLKNNREITILPNLRAHLCVFELKK